MNRKIKIAAISLLVVAACTCLIAAAYAALTHTSVPQNVAIEAYVAPSMLFPEDGEYPEGTARLYKPFPVHASPDGKLVGHVDTNYAKCGVACKDTGVATLILLDGRRVPLKIEAWGYATSGLFTFEPSIASGKSAWSKILYDGGAFWIKTPRKDIHPYEPMASRIDHFDTFCNKPGNCKPLTPEVQKQLGELNFNSCFPDPYSIVGIVTVGGQRYYQVRLEQFTPLKTPLIVPRKGYIPTRNKDGKHSGTYDPMGC